MKEIGYCRFCKNSRMVMDPPEDPSEETLNDLASEQCDCEGARLERKKKADHKTMCNYIDTITDKEEVAKAIKHFIRPLQDHKAQAISVKVDDQTKLTLKVNQDGELTINKTYTDQTEYSTN